jgi:hypothetical protein
MNKMGTICRQDKAQFAEFFDTCTVPGCGRVSSNWQRVNLPDARSLSWGSRDALKVYSYMYRPRYRRCYKCAAKLFEARRTVVA